LTVATATIPLHSPEDVANPNVVKAVGGLDGRALYFSRHPIPFRKGAPSGAADVAVAASGRHRKHIGIYLYAREFLLRFVRLPPAPLELAESLEQLRILEHGFPIYLVDVEEDSVSVDTPEDLERVERICAGFQGAGAEREASNGGGEVPA